MKILVLNSGSSSQKSCLYDIAKSLPPHPPAPTWEGKIEWNGDQADIQAQNSQGARLKDRVEAGSRSDAIERLLDTLWNGKLRVPSAPSELDAVGHRVVHGGESLQEATAITPEDLLRRFRKAQKVDAAFHSITCPAGVRWHPSAT